MTKPVIALLLSYVVITNGTYASDCYKRAITATVITLSGLSIIWNLIPMLKKDSERAFYDNYLS